MATLIKIRFDLLFCILAREQLRMRRVLSGKQHNCRTRVVSHALMAKFCLAQSAISMGIHI